MNNISSYYLQETYLRQFEGQFIKLIGEDASEVITRVSLILTQISTTIYNIEVVCVTYFNQRTFSEINIFETNVESTVQQISKNIAKEITQPLKEFCLP